MVAYYRRTIFELSEDECIDSTVKISGKYVSIILTRLPKTHDIKEILSDLRTELNPNVAIQLINASIVYNLDHLLRTLLITFEAEKRNNIFVRNKDIDLLLRLAYSKQISDAILFAGPTKSGTVCLLLYSRSMNALTSARRSVYRRFECSFRVALEATFAKKVNISARLGIDHTFFDEANFVRYLIERAALLVR